MMMSAIPKTIQPMAHLSRSSSSLDIDLPSPLLLGSWLPIGQPGGGGRVDINAVQSEHGQDLLALLLSPVLSGLNQPDHVVAGVDLLLVLVRLLPGEPFPLLQRRYRAVA